MDPAIMRLTRQMVAARNSAEARVMERRLLRVRTRGRGAGGVGSSVEASVSRGK